MKSLLIVALVVMVSEGLPAAQDPLSAAKDLYASAAYEEALSALAAVDGDAAPALARQADEYRAFCLFALGRTREAESVTESLIRRQPLATLDAADTSPRLERLFADVRKRLLPALVREQFRTARVEIDRKNFGDAEAPLTDARLLIAEAERLGVKDDGLADLSVLVDGFLRLIHAAAEQRPALRADAIAAPPSSSPSTVRAESAAPVARAEFPAASAAAPVYTITDVRVSPPVTVDQNVPGMPPALRAIARSTKKTGILDVVIDESGHVVDVTMRQSLHAAYDSTVVRSAARWKYQPATIDGVPVRFVKTIVLIP
jgi:TonB family protein